MDLSQQPLIKLSRDDNELVMLLGVNYDAVMLRNRMNTFFDFISTEPVILDDRDNVKRNEVFVNSYVIAGQALAKLN